MGAYGERDSSMKLDPTFSDLKSNFENSVLSFKRCSAVVEAAPASSAMDIRMTNTQENQVFPVKSCFQ